MRLRLDAGQQILLICAEIWAKRLNSGQFRPNFRAESPAPARINILWLRTQSNKPFPEISNTALMKYIEFRGFLSTIILFDQLAYLNPQSLHLSVWTLCVLSTFMT